MFSLPAFLGTLPTASLAETDLPRFLVRALARWTLDELPSVRQVLEREVLSGYPKALAPTMATLVEVLEAEQLDPAGLDPDAVDAILARPEVIEELEARAPLRRTVLRPGQAVTRETRREVGARLDVLPGFGPRLALVAPVTVRRIESLGWASLRSPVLARLMSEDEAELVQEVWHQLEERTGWPDGEGRLWEARFVEVASRPNPDAATCAERLEPWPEDGRRRLWKVLVEHLRQRELPEAHRPGPQVLVRRLEEEGAEVEESLRRALYGIAERAYQGCATDPRVARGYVPCRGVDRDAYASWMEVPPASRARLEALEPAVIEQEIRLLSARDEGLVQAAQDPTLAWDLRGLRDVYLRRYYHRDVTALQGIDPLRLIEELREVGEDRQAVQEALRALERRILDEARTPEELEAAEEAGREAPDATGAEEPGTAGAEPAPAPATVGPSGDEDAARAEGAEPASRGEASEPPEASEPSGDEAVSEAVPVDEPTAEGGEAPDPEGSELSPDIESALEAEVAEAAAVAGDTEERTAEPTGTSAGRTGEDGASEPGEPTPEPPEAGEPAEASPNGEGPGGDDVDPDAGVASSAAPASAPGSEGARAAPTGGATGSGSPGTPSAEGEAMEASAPAGASEAAGTGASPSREERALVEGEPAGSFHEASTRPVAQPEAGAAGNAEPSSRAEGGSEAPSPRRSRTGARKRATGTPWPEPGRRRERTRQHVSAAGGAGLGEAGASTAGPGRPPRQPESRLETKRGAKPPAVTPAEAEHFYSSAFRELEVLERDLLERGPVEDAGETLGRIEGEAQRLLEALEPPARSGDAGFEAARRRVERVRVYVERVRARVQAVAPEASDEEEAESQGPGFLRRLGRLFKGGAS